MTTQTGLGWPTETTGKASRGLGWPTSLEPPRIAVQGDALVAVDADGREIESADISDRLRGETAPASRPLLGTDEESVRNAGEKTELAADDVTPGRGMTVSPDTQAEPMTTDVESVRNAEEKAELSETPSGTAARDAAPVPDVSYPAAGGVSRTFSRDAFFAGRPGVTVVPGAPDAGRPLPGMRQVRDASTDPNAPMRPAFPAATEDLSERDDAATARAGVQAGGATDAASDATQAADDVDGAVADSAREPAPTVEPADAPSAASPAPGDLNESQAAIHAQSDELEAQAAHDVADDEHVSAPATEQVPDLEGDDVDQSPASEVTEPEGAPVHKDAEAAVAEGADGEPKAEPHGLVADQGRAHDQLSSTLDAALARLRGAATPTIPPRADTEPATSSDRREPDVQENTIEVASSREPSGPDADEPNGTTEKGDVDGATPNEPVPTAVADADDLPATDAASVDASAPTTDGADSRRPGAQGEMTTDDGGVRDPQEAQQEAAAPALHAETHGPAGTELGRHDASPEESEQHTSEVHEMEQEAETSPLDAAREQPVPAASGAVPTPAAPREPATIVAPPGAHEPEAARDHAAEPDETPLRASADGVDDEREEAPRADAAGPPGHEPQEARAPEVTEPTTTERSSSVETDTPDEPDEDASAGEIPTGEPTEAPVADELPDDGPLPGADALRAAQEPPPHGGRRSRTRALASAWDDRPDRDVADRALFGEDGESGRQVLAESAAVLSPGEEAPVSRETLLTERPVAAIPTIDLPVAERSKETAGSLVDAHLSGRARAVQARTAAEKGGKEHKAGTGPLPIPRRTRVLTVANQKGGVGKTTTTVNVAAALAKAGLKVVVIDLDPQGNASTALGVPHDPDVNSVYDVLVDGMPIADVVQPCPDIPGLMCAPATIDLAGAEIELVSLVAREMRLGRALTAYLRHREDAGDRIDYVLIDCPPSLGLLTINAFVAAEEVFIPIQCEYYALEGLSQLLKNIELIKAHLNPMLHVSTILLTMFDGRTRLSSQVADEVRRHFGRQVVNAMVPRSVRISEAPSHGQTVITYDPTSSGALSYTAAAAEIAEAGASQEGAR